MMASSRTSDGAAKRPAGGLLAPSKFAPDFGTKSDSQRLFTGFKASKLATVAQSLTGGAAKLAKETTKNVTPTSNSPPPPTNETKSASSTAFIPLGKKNDCGGSSPPPLPALLPGIIHTTQTASEGSDKTSDSSTFVFGQNLFDRAENVPESTREDNGSAATREKNETQFLAELEPLDSSSSKSLTESAAEYCENHQALKRKYDEVEVVTGEENERNAIHMNAKLYLYDSFCWVERGRGQLHLNDRRSDDNEDNIVSSRLVMRTFGSLRVILNTKVYKGMSVERSGEKSIRLTGNDDVGEAKVFLISSSIKDIDSLQSALTTRLTKLNDKPSAAEDQASTNKIAKIDNNSSS